jgi:serine protease
MAGVVALMLAANPTLTPTDINDLIAGTHEDANAGPITQDLGDPGKDTYYGYGLINAYQAVNVANSITGGGGNAIPDNTPVLSVFPNPLQFSTATDSLELSLENIGTASLDVTAISDNADWLTLSTISLPLTIGTDDAATKVTVSVDRDGLAGGTQLATISITSTGGSVSLPVSLQVQSSSGGDVGEVYVLVVDPDTYYTVSQAITRQSSSYAFRTARDVPQGRYFVAAGTDRNNDGSICEAGEACGLYPLIDSPTQFDLNADLSGVDFIVSYDFFTSQAAARVADALGVATFGGFQRLDFERVKKMDENMGEEQ